jgi:hypothetical protein
MDHENLTVTEIDINANVDELIKDQYLAAELEEVIKLQKYAKEVRFIRFMLKQKSTCLNRVLLTGWSFAQRRQN